VSAVKSKKLHQIGEVADRVGLSLRTVRYYEEAGLVRPSERTDGGFRLYGEEEVARLEVIKQMKPLGFSLQEMRELLDARDVLDRGKAGEPGFEQALERLSQFSDAARRKCIDLDDQLRTAAQFVARLRRESRRHRHPSEPRTGP
jgi:DNA-binding transcriptional MerR regulator